jgi:hypothetical protein
MDVWLSAIISGVISGVVGGACGAKLAIRSTSVRQRSSGAASPNTASGRDTRLG